MSQINVNRIKDSNKGAPDFPSGVNVGGITSTVTLGVTNLTATNVNVSGVVTATTLDGNLLATGTPTLGLGVTINTSGLNISGVATAGIVSATTLYGDGTNITGIALSIAPLNYNPAAYGIDLDKSTGIGLTFNQGVKSGSGNVTLRETNGSGTVVQNWGVGSSITYTGDEISMSLDSNLSENQVYHLSYPSGAFTNLGGDVSYVGTAYTFVTKAPTYSLWSWGRNQEGTLGHNNTTKYSSPTQIPGSWTRLGRILSSKAAAAAKTAGSLWVWGHNEYGQLGQNSAGDERSSPVQVPGTTWAYANLSHKDTFVTKTDGTLWAWGHNDYGELGQNNLIKYSSPVQIPGTTWKLDGGAIAGGNYVMAVKTNGTLWAMGYNDYGGLGQNNTTKYSSPVQIPGTTWDLTTTRGNQSFASKTDGTLWAWGYQEYGELGLNEYNAQKSSPVQIPGTTWNSGLGKMSHTGNSIYAIKTDGTLWAWGGDGYTSGVLGLNQSNGTNYSSPIQIPGTDWVTVTGGDLNVLSFREA